jgi:hypothetical protein
LAVSYEIVTHDRTGRERVHAHTGEDVLTPGSVVLIEGRYWLVDRIDQARVRTRPARYRLTLRHPGGRQESGAFRRFRADAPIPGHQLTTLEDGAPISWVVVEQRLEYDAAGEPFLESIAERDYTERESLPDHQLEHALDQERNDGSAIAAVLMGAEAAGLAIELVGLEEGQVADWDEARNYLSSLILEEIEDDLFDQCGVNTRRDPRETWLDTVKQRLGGDLDSFRASVEARGGEIEEWEFRGGRTFAAIGRFDDDSNPFTGYGWMCRLVDAGVLQAGGFKRVRKPLLLL